MMLWLNHRYEWLGVYQQKLGRRLYINRIDFSTTLFINCITQNINTCSPKYNLCSVSCSEDITDYLCILFTLKYKFCWRVLMVHCTVTCYTTSSHFSLDRIFRIFSTETCFRVCRRYFNGWQLAKMKKSIPDMSLPWNIIGMKQLV